VPNIASAKKRMRQSRKRRVVNRAQRSAVRSAMKQVREATTGKDAQAAYRRAESLLDRAARKGRMKKNTAARYKSRLAKVVAAKS
jgi:small subunit ribosomal protein S20